MNVKLYSLHMCNPSFNWLHLFASRSDCMGVVFFVDRNDLNKVEHKRLVYSNADIAELKNNGFYELNRVYILKEIFLPPNEGLSDLIHVIWHFNGTKEATVDTKYRCKRIGEVWDVIGALENGSLINIAFDNKMVLRFVKGELDNG